MNPDDESSVSAINLYPQAQKAVSKLMNDSETALANLLREPELFDGDILSTIHHDFRNDLNLLTNYSELLDSNGSDGETVHVISKKLAGSIDALMVCLRLESGSLMPSPEPIDPIDRMEERVDWFRSLYEHLDLDFTVTVENPPGSLRTDRQFFQLILDSLLILGSQKPEGETEIILSGTTATPPVSCLITLRQSNPPWRRKRTPELKNTLREEPLQKLMSNFSARAGLLLHTVRTLLETLGGNLEIPPIQDENVLLKTTVPQQDPDSE